MTASRCLAKSSSSAAPRSLARSLGARSLSDDAASPSAPPNGPSRSRLRATWRTPSKNIWLRLPTEDGRLQSVVPADGHLGIGFMLVKREDHSARLLTDIHASPRYRLLYR